MGQAGLFSILHSVDSTNNYAMAKLHAGLANHGMAWFAEEQHGGKGQRGKSWNSAPGENLLMSVVIEPVGFESNRQFEISVMTALCCHRFLQKYAGHESKIKWPNDIYFRDRKAGGILIENILHGRNWKFSVIGIGININQVEFNGFTNHATSLKNITGRSYNPEQLARELHLSLLEDFKAINHRPFPAILRDYNNVLYKKDEDVMLKINGITTCEKIKRVDTAGRLITGNAPESAHDFGTIEWMIDQPLS